MSGCFGNSTEDRFREKELDNYTDNEQDEFTCNECYEVFTKDERIWQLRGNIYLCPFCGSRNINC